MCIRDSAKIVAPLTKALEGQPHRILVSPDHPTFIRTKTHTHGFVPFTIAGDGITADDSSTYDEVSAADSSRRFDNGSELMDLFLN